MVQVGDTVTFHDGPSNRDLDATVTAVHGDTIDLRYVHPRMQPATVDQPGVMQGGHDGGWEPQEGKA